MFFLVASGVDDRVSSETGALGFRIKHVPGSRIEKLKEDLGKDGAVETTG